MKHKWAIGYFIFHFVFQAAKKAESDDSEDDDEPLVKKKEKKTPAKVSLRYKASIFETNNPRLVIGNIE